MRSQATKSLLPVTGYWLLVTGYWLLVTGYWLLVTGHHFPALWLVDYFEVLSYQTAQYFTSVKALKPLLHRNQAIYYSTCCAVVMYCLFLSYSMSMHTKRYIVCRVF